MAHLSCVGETRDGLASILDRFAAIGIENVLALRGDPPRGRATSRRPRTGSPRRPSSPADRRRLRLLDRGRLLSRGPPRGAERGADLAYLKTKVESGASFLITQLFFDNRAYFDFVASARELGIDVPIIPGVIPIASFGQVARICDLCDATIPAELEEAMRSLGGDEEAEDRVGRSWRARTATRSCLGPT